MRLAGRVALVTGASHERGIGRGIALALAAEGGAVAGGGLGVVGAGGAQGAQKPPPGRATTL
ncbi:MAG: short-chain dehydrogenase, partial [Thermoleophilia bacterium]|nr:short-chain dehydrogenase [Thermoleophilia bacterium]